MILYGLSTCDTCKRAMKTLRAAGHDVAFRDVRSDPLTTAEIDVIVHEFGSRVVNQQSTTYRAFSDILKASEPEAQIAAQPAVMKRPVVQDGNRWHLGWDSATQEAVLGPR